ncbi:MAG: lipopolysaccharide heptosyltransferase I [Candidatus Sulfobium sp.]
MKSMGIAKQPKKILIVKPSSLGDVVHSLPFLNSLRSCFPKSEIHWVIAKGLEGLLEGHPMIDGLIIINKDMWKKISRTGQTLREIRALFRRLRDGGYDMVIDLQGLLRSGLITASTGAPLRIGFAEAREGSTLFYSRRVGTGRNMHAVERYLEVAHELGCNSGDVIFPFPLVKSGLKRIKELKTSLRDYVVLVPGARWDTKVWPAESFGRLASMLPLKSVVVGNGKDVAIADRIVGMAGGKTVSLAGRTTLAELIEVMRDARMVVSNDSGPMHIAAALNVPVAALFGPTSPERTGPYGKGHVIIRSERECSPCFRKRCRDFRCMAEISPEAVFGKIRGFFPW